MRRAGRSQRKWLTSHCRRRSGTKSRQRRDQGPRAQFHPRATASDFPLCDPIPSDDQSSSPPPTTHRPNTTPSETPRSAAHRVQQCSLCHACQSSANIRLRGGNGNRPLGGPPSSPITSAIPSYLFPACCPVQTWLSWCSAHFRQSPAKVITCEIGQPNSPTHRYPKVSGLGSAFPDAGN